MLKIIAGGLIRAGGWKNFQKLISGGDGKQVLKGNVSCTKVEAGIKSISKTK